MSGFGPASTFGDALRAYRLSAGLTQEDLAERSGVSARQIRRLEAGTHAVPRRATVRMLGRSLGLGEERCRQLMQRAYPDVDTIGEREPVVSESAPGGGSVTDGHVPATLTPLVGRQKRIERIANKLACGDARLVTITGPPGIGKTRVAIEVARKLEHWFERIHFVRLEPIADHELVLGRIYEVTGDRAIHRALTLEDIAMSTGDTHTLLVLDTMEHLLEAAPLIPRLLERCPNLAVLVTSRVRLRVSGEHREPLAPLSLPRTASSPSEGVSESEALFVLRACAADPDFDLNNTTAPLVADICRRVDGVPLAVELAAAQLGRMSLQSVAANAKELLPLLVDGPRDRPDRQQTMSKSLDWSYSLLTAGEQQLLRRLSVFRDGFGLDAVRVLAEELGDGEAASHDPEQSARLLSALVEQHLVVPLGAATAMPRFGLLNLVREFAASKLEQTGQAEAARDAHARIYAALAIENERDNWIPGDAASTLSLANELPNIRLALRRLEETGDVERLLGVAAALLGVWTARGNLQEGDRWLRRALALGRAASAATRAKASLAQGQTAFYLGNPEAATSAYACALELAIEDGDPFLVACASSANAGMAVFHGEYGEGKELCRQALEAIERIDDRALSDSLAIWLPGTLARAEHGLGNLTLADRSFEAAARGMREFGHPRGLSRVLGAWATLAVDCGSPGVALERYLESVALALQSGDEVFAAIGLRLTAAVWALTGEMGRASRMLGALEAFERRNVPVVRLTAMDVAVEKAGLAALEAVGNVAEQASQREAGTQLTLLQAFEEAAQTLADSPMGEMPTWAAISPGHPACLPGFTH